MHAIEARGLRRTFGDVVAVDGIDLVIDPGEVVAVLGPNGAGKTTTIEMLLGMRTPTAGTIRVLGGSPTDKAVRARVGAMLQDTDAPGSLTAAEVVDLVGSYHPTRIPTALALGRADLTAQAHQRVSQLSGGQRQRLSFAVALVGDPDVLYLDEPTAALDVAARGDLWEHVRAFAALGRTILYTSHNLAEVAGTASRVVVIDHGRIIADGTPAEIRRIVEGSTIKATTDAAAHTLAALPGLRTFEDPGGTTRRVALHVADAVPALRALLASGAEVTELEVNEASLEDAFFALTGADHPHDRVAPSTTGPTSAEEALR
ncbi:ATP-binding cassette domain-containing protein [Sanguibacter sp. A247]|uniref:ATP-binding cassette domain-containing protein n=1 Tax=unclassified Sanguibacter TaxID=2645534 RepID=UPI003FD7F415